MRFENLTKWTGGTTKNFHLAGCAKLKYQVEVRQWHRSTHNVTLFRFECHHVLGVFLDHRTLVRARGASQNHKTRRFKKKKKEKKMQKKEKTKFYVSSVGKKVRIINVYTWTTLPVRKKARPIECEVRALFWDVQRLASNERALQMRGMCSFVRPDISDIDLQPTHCIRPMIIGDI